MLGATYIIITYYLLVIGPGNNDSGGLIGGVVGAVLAVLIAGTVVLLVTLRLCVSRCYYHTAMTTADK